MPNSYKEKILGCIHGRFQPFHLGHLHYFELALAEVDKVIIGITQFDNINLSDCFFSGKKYRSKKNSNPLTYAERVSLITNVLMEKGYDKSRFCFTKFPIDNPELLQWYISKNVVCYTTVLEEWNLNKVNILQRQKYKVKVLIKDINTERKMSSSNIREKICKNDHSWKQMVTPSTVAFLDSIKFKERLLGLSEELL